MLLRRSNGITEQQPEIRYHPPGGRQWEAGTHCREHPDSYLWCRCILQYNFASRGDVTITLQACRVSNNMLAICRFIIGRTGCKGDCYPQHDKKSEKSHIFVYLSYPSLLRSLRTSVFTKPIISFPKRNCSVANQSGLPLSC